jgi:hypothetical protein
MPGDAQAGGVRGQAPQGRSGTTAGASEPEFEGMLSLRAMSRLVHRGLLHPERAFRSRLGSILFSTSSRSTNP